MIHLPAPDTLWRGIRGIGTRDLPSRIPSDETVKKAHGLALAFPVRPTVCGIVTMRPPG
ncbi:hypothetical protein GCM10010991_15730 [Gemmobacter aquaticus]|uniref:Uncharacterized protein n=1 Tax=Gemmobacter aquaticus TaxID=490185 RepID=A0A917YJD8_9RHOB|nr:hypothetical protein GCM10010991_15730 [Gemmobacter aquaticus]